MSARLRARAIGLMRQLDSGGGYKDAIERELAQRLGAASAPGAPGAPGAPSAPGAPGASGSARQEPSGELRRDLAEGGPSARSLCVCGTQNDLDARFCKTCGAKLTA
jgi:hypothetical protein